MRIKQRAADEEERMSHSLAQISDTVIEGRVKEIAGLSRAALMPGTGEVGAQLRLGRKDEASDYCL